jgi:hypothetical protein
VKRRRSRPLAVTVTRGVLTIEIGVDTLAHAALRSAFVCQMAHEHGEVDPATRFKITDARGFADEVKSELLAEEEDGSSLLTDVLDRACQEAIEQGSEFFVDKDDEP